MGIRHGAGPKPNAFDVSSNFRLFQVNSLCKGREGRKKGEDQPDPYTDTRLISSLDEVVEKARIVRCIVNKGAGKKVVILFCFVFG